MSTTIKLKGRVDVKRLEGKINLVPSASSGGPLQAKTVYPSHSEQAIAPDEDYYGLAVVTVKPVPRVPAAEVGITEGMLTWGEFVENVVNIVTGSEVTSRDLQLVAVRSTGTQYFDTGIMPDANTEVEIKYSVQNLITYGPHILSSNNWFCPFPRGVDNKFFSSRFGADATLNINYSLNTECTVKAFPNNEIYINGNLVGTLSNGTTVSSKSIHMFTYGGNAGASNYTGNVTVYYCKIWKSGVLVRDFVPHKTEDGTIGMLDLVENKFYASQGSGQFSGVYG